MASWNAVIDVSNVCWSPYLPPVGKQAPAWDRLALVMGVWRRLHGAEAHFELVADESLVRVLGPDARHFLDLKRAGAIRTASVADGEILRLARDLGLHVITRDHYTDHRASHRWIEQSPERFHAWDTVDDVVTLAPLGIKTRSAQDVSQAREVKVLRHSAKLDARNPAHRRILQTRWSCPNTACRQAAQWQGQLLAFPRVSPEGAAVCPSCTRPLVSLGPRAAMHEVVVADLESQEELLRFPLELDCPVIVGRGAAVKGIDLAMYAVPGSRTAIDTVSRQHLMLNLQDAGSANMRLSVLDLNSTNGTTVQRWTGRSFEVVQQVPADRETHLGTRDRVILGDTLLLRLSGKRYLTEPTTPPPGLASPDADPSATAITRVAGFRPLLRSC